MFFVHLVGKLVFWPYCPKTPTHKSQVGSDKNFASLIELNRAERANDKDVRYT